MATLGFFLFLSGVSSGEGRMVTSEDEVGDKVWFFDGLKLGFLGWDDGYQGPVTTIQGFSIVLNAIRLGRMEIGETRTLKEAGETKQVAEASIMTKMKEALQIPTLGGPTLWNNLSVGMKETGPAVAFSLFSGGRGSVRAVAGCYQDLGAILIAV